MGCILFSGVATGIWEQIGSPTSISVSSIYTKLISSGSVGKLDILINGCHYIDSGECIAPVLSSEEISIYEQLYLVDYYAKAALQTQGAPGTLQWTSLAEGDTKISRANPNEIAKFYKDLQKAAQTQLDNLVDLYRRNSALARSSDYPQIEQYYPNGPFNQINYDYRAQ